MKNTGKPYEALTEQVFTRLLDQHRVCAQVERDVVLEGRSTKHQIDVMFEFVVGPASYRTIIQCKDWGSAVKQEQVLAFVSVLQDVPGQPRGIMVSRSGFQEGARRVADHHGIKLYELRDARDEDWDGLIRTVQIEGILLAPEFRSVAFNFDVEWFRERALALGIPKGTTFNTRTIPGVHQIVLESGRACDIRTLTRAAIPDEACDWRSFEVSFEEAVLVETPDLPLPQLRAIGARGEVRLREIRSHFELRLDHLVAYCFRDVLGGDHRFLRADGSPVHDPADADEVSP
ncbi:MAG: restriction endonuclease [Polyangiaceae bacterium]|nr:restriction endonuclease [Polyangiaceae bacterium]MBK8943172.1 restriction endonuclease [Polyangiaceae bacterium]